MTISAHYDKFEVKLTEKELKEGVIRLDPYRVALEWELGVKDPSGCLFHLLKTIARFGNKKGNTTARELASLKATIARFSELLEDGKAEGLGQETIDEIRHAFDKYIDTSREAPWPLKTAKRARADMKNAGDIFDLNIS